MQNVLVALIIIAFLGGVLSKCNSGHSSSGKSIFSMLGFKSKEEIQNEELNKLVNKYLKDQAQYLGDSEEVTGPLSQFIQDSYKKDKNLNLLPLQALMKNFSDQNSILVKNGKGLSTYYDQQKKLNQQMAQSIEVSRFLSKSDQLDILNQQKAVLEKQKELISELHNKIKEIQNDPSNKSQLLDKASNASSKIAEHLDQLKLQQQAINNMNNKALSNRDSIKEKSEDLKRKNQDSMRDNHDRVEDQTRRINDRIRDQMEKLRNNK